MYSRHSVARLLSVAVVASSIAINISASHQGFINLPNDHAAQRTRARFHMGTQSAAVYFVTQQLKAPMTDKIANAMGAQADNKVLNAGQITSLLVHVGVEGIRINQAGFALNPKYMAKVALATYTRDKIVQFAVYGLSKVGYEAGDKTKATLQVLTTVFVLPSFYARIDKAKSRHS